MNCRNITLPYSIGGGSETKIPLYTFGKTSQNKPKVVIQAGVHGAELQGNAVIFQLMKLLNNCLISGEIILIPCANPIGVNHKLGGNTVGRFDLNRGDNWNRNYFEVDTKDYLEYVSKAHFQSFMAQQIGQTLENTSQLSIGKMLNYRLQQVFCDADIFLDLHTGPNATEYLYSPYPNKEKSCDLEIDAIIDIPTTFHGAADEALFAPWYQISAKMSVPPSDIPEVYTVELGSEEFFCLDIGLRQAQKIMRFLAKRGVLKFPSSFPEAISARTICRAPLERYRTYFALSGGFHHFFVKPGDWVEKNQPLYQTVNFDHIQTQQDLENCPQFCAPNAGKVIFTATSNALAMGTEIIAILENPEISSTGR